ncbi:MAG: hypothetical protein ABR579_07975 [Actinomycetota bacterium]
MGSRRKPPWYRTTPGQVVAVLVALAVVIAVIAVVQHVRNNSKQNSATQHLLDTYTGRVRSLLVKITPAATEMTGAPSSNTDPKAVAALKKSTTDWAKTFEGALTEMQQVAGTGSASPEATQVFTQSLQLYSTSVQTFKVVPSLASDQQDTILGTAQAEFAEAGDLWTTAVSLLDKARDDVGLPASDLRSPQSSVPNSSTPAPQTSFSIPSGAGSKGGSGGKGSGKSKSGK